MIRKIIIICSAFLLTTNAHSQDVKGEMSQVYSAYKTLQKYLYSENAFNSDKNKILISSNLSNLSNSFHKVDELNSPYRKVPGFEATLKIVQELLEDSSKSFDKGNVSYAQWRLRSISNHCATCHFTYNVKLHFNDDSVVKKGMTDSELANFYYATRQFDKASDLFLKVAKANHEKFEAMTSLRKWLVVQTRVNTNPEKSYKTLKEILDTLKFPTYEQEELNRWLSSLKDWKDNPRPLDSFSDAEKIIHSSISSNPLGADADEVSLLKATEKINSLLSDLKGSERAKALLLLGMSYNQLSLFFIDELPELYLELAILDAPGSSSAKSAFRIYQDIVERNYTGSGGTQVPADVRLKLIELWNKAYDIHTLSSPQS